MPMRNERPFIRRSVESSVALSLPNMGGPCSVIL
jgi:hypothetical protein